MSASRPQPELTSLHTPYSYFEPLPLDCIFPSNAPLEVEIGCGNGSFLITYAAQNPETNFLGIERLLGRIRKLDRKAKRAGVSNIKIVRVEAAYCVEYMLPPESIHACHIYFPDPWPKKKHWKKRLIAPKFVEQLAVALQLGGRVYLRTDNEPYFEQILQVFGDNKRFQATVAPPELTQIVTHFERSFNAEGISTLRAQYRLREAD
ncbi:MAG: tRNA (guanine-N(7)-)-methyltransferase [Verrucomicrobia subdivision 3 bacterium]|nr:tRNA (guanine-N(7)-)-methyltransferase [Limisphaerales bacterium]MCS1416244.1 tRNA (guanine-N(7)-)-methyltransferase [Limisphaerales bacterium]